MRNPPAELSNTKPQVCNMCDTVIVRKVRPSVRATVTRATVTRATDGAVRVKAFQERDARPDVIIFWKFARPPLNPDVHPSPLFPLLVKPSALGPRLARLPPSPSTTSYLKSNPPA
ncbi:unnamed protein product [Pleuronectes platessa]|uniref:Uncharacterized protein n=1 Tax=Pleuronectes platessa TaxID=8262 RepID=A0A9N7U001_PLEPL|nr:unnamed protein product [Pleuronectes platessa]